MSVPLDLVLNAGFPLLLLIVTYIIGNAIEKKHFKDILARERRLRSFPVITFDTLPSEWKVGSAELVTGSVVISLDYFKRVLATLRSLIGGRVKPYEPLLDRARREAMLRMIEDAKNRGFNAVVNVRIDTSRLANARRDSHGIAGVEMLAFGTAITLL